jgi:hypothetical protein
LEIAMTAFHRTRGRGGREAVDVKTQVRAAKKVRAVLARGGLHRWRK